MVSRGSAGAPRSETSYPPKGNEDFYRAHRRSLAFWHHTTWRSRLNVLSSSGFALNFYRARKVKRLPTGYQPLEGSARQMAPGARLIGPADPNEPLSVTIVVRRHAPLPNLEDWQAVPPEKRTYLSREEFA